MPSYHFTGAVAKRFPSVPQIRGFVEPGAVVALDAPVDHPELEPIARRSRKEPIAEAPAPADAEAAPPEEI